MSTTYIIYKYTSPSGKSYIGQTNNIKRRTSEHKSPTNGCIHFRNAIQKYGWNNFIREILAENLTLYDSNILEEQFIEEHNTLFPFGYNLRSGGQNQFQTEETKQKISNTKKGVPSGRKGIPCPEETKQKISNTTIGRPCPEDKKQQISLTKTGQTHTPLSIQKMCKPKSENHSKNISKGKKGTKRRINPETGKREYYFPEVV